MNVLGDLKGKSALVTGASSGLGAHFARILAAEGMDVIVAARRADALTELVDGIAGSGGTARAVTLDVGDPDAIEAMWEAVGWVDVLVNNAGVTVAKPALDYTPADWDHVIDTNLRGAFFVATGAARKMRAAGREGSIVNIASILGLRQASAVAAYAVSKAGVVQMSQSLALELARYGIRVNALCPGYFGTNLNREYFATDAGQAMIRRIPQRRLGQLSDLDGPLLLLASSASAYMTGAVIAVDGGHLVSGL